MKFRFWKRSKPANEFDAIRKQAAEQLQEEIEENRKKALTELEKQIDTEKDKLYPSRSLVLLTTETDIVLIPCKVLDDHKLELRHKGKKKTVQINPDRQAHIMTIPCSQIWPTRLGRILSPRKQVYRVYTLQAEGEMTHNPHDDKLDEHDKMRLEAVLKLQGTAAKAEIAANIMKGLKDKASWIDFIPYIAITVIVLMFLFAFQIAPFLKG